MSFGFLFARATSGLLSVTQQPSLYKTFGLAAASAFAGVANPMDSNGAISAPNPIVFTALETPTSHFMYPSFTFRRSDILTGQGFAQSDGVFGLLGITQS